MTLEARASRLWPPNTISSHEDGERLDRALSDLMKEGQRIHDFNERLNHVIEDTVRNAQLRRGSIEKAICETHRAQMSGM
jgi:hypothetical protein